MNIDKTIDGLEQGFQNPDIILKRVSIPDDKMTEYGLRRKTKEVTEHWVWMLSVGERGQAPTVWFLDHKVKGVMLKAMDWRGIPRVTRTKKNGAAQPQVAG